MDLLLDIKKYIANNDAYVWFKMYMIDDEFKQYASSDEGIYFFTSHFLTTINGETKLDLLDLHHNIDDLPAIVSMDLQKWYCMGKRHRENDLPAIICYNGGKSWFYNGHKHRENDLPATIFANGDKNWFCNGRIHRENDLPAVIHANGNQYWFYNDLQHRENDLPAVIIDNDGTHIWYKNGIKIKKTKTKYY